MTAGEAEVDGGSPAPARGRGAPMSGAERVAAAGFLLAASLAALAFTTPLDAGPSTAPEPALLARPAPAGEGAYLAAVAFDPGRRAQSGPGILPPPPGMAPVVETVAPPPVEGPPMLAGILVGGLERKAAFVGSEGAWQGVGSMVGSWTLAAIEPGRVTLSRDGEDMQLTAAGAITGR